MEIESIQTLDQNPGDRHGFICLSCCLIYTINNLRYADDTTLMAESEEELKNLFMKVKEKGEEVGLNMVSSLHSKQMGKQWKQCQTLFLGAPKSLQMVIAAMKLKDAYSLEGKL